jgi:hypothetical protein
MSGTVYDASDFEGSCDVFDFVFDATNTSTSQTWGVTQDVAELYSWNMTGNSTIFSDASVPRQNYVLRHQGFLTFVESGLYTFFLTSNNYARFTITHPNATVIDVGAGILEGSTTVFITDRYCRVFVFPLYLSFFESVGSHFRASVLFGIRTCRFLHHPAHLIRILCVCVSIFAVARHTVWRSSHIETTDHLLSAWKRLSIQQ